MPDVSAAVQSALACQARYDRQRIRLEQEELAQLRRKQAAYEKICGRLVRQLRDAHGQRDEARR